uniref:Uncharacterized protein n=1 Tax=Aegilops tauschii subsp. strangulata TaxID=200361 RepID=A0A452ZFD2_AEGTS
MYSKHYARLCRDCLTKFHLSKILLCSLCEFDADVSIKFRSAAERCLELYFVCGSRPALKVNLDLNDLDWIGL